MTTVTVVLISFGAGLIVGWNVLPQPAWVQRLYTKAKDEIEDRID